MKNRLLVLLCCLLCTSASAVWEPLFPSQVLCAATCSGRWSRPQLSPDLKSVVVSETRGQTTSLWKVAVSQPQSRVLVYRGAVQSWALDAAPYLLVLRPDGTLLSYDMTRRRQRWATHIPFPVPGAALELLIVGELLALRIADPAAPLTLMKTVNGQIVGLTPGFELRRVPAVGRTAEPLPVTTLKVLGETVEHSALAFRLTRNGSGTVNLEGYAYRDADLCVACGFNK